MHLFSGPAASEQVPGLGFLLFVSVAVVRKNSTSDPKDGRFPQAHAFAFLDLSDFALSLYLPDGGGITHASPPWFVA